MPQQHHDEMKCCKKPGVQAYGASMRHNNWISYGWSKMIGIAVEDVLRFKVTTTFIKDDKVDRFPTSDLGNSKCKEER